MSGHRETAHLKGKIMLVWLERGVKKLSPSKRCVLARELTKKNKISVKKAANVLRLLSLGRTIEFNQNKDVVGQVLYIICGIGLYEKERMKDL